MRFSRWSLLLFIAGILVPLAWAGSREDLADFRSMPPAKQEHLVKFTGEWQNLDPETRGRLAKVLMRYTDWLSRLPEDQRRTILEAPNARKKLELIKKLREKQRLARLPKTDREKVENTKTDAERQKAISDLRVRERRREVNWQFFLIRSEDQQAFTQQMNKLHDEVFAKLRFDEKQRLRSARTDGWPLYPKTLLELAQKHNVPVPPLVQSRITLLTTFPHINLEKLRDFAGKIEDRTIRETYESRMTEGDEAQREEAILELTRLYWEMHPYELKKAREDEERRRQMQKKLMGK